MGNTLVCPIWGELRYDEICTSKIKNPSRKAKRFCSEIGRGWHLPSKAELQAIYQQKEAIDNALAQIGKVGITNGRYWSSEKYKSDRAWAFHMLNGSTNRSFKFGTYSVRAVAAF